MSREISEITEPSILEITDQLGEPDAIYRASVRKMTTRVIFGILGLLFTLFFLVMFISETIPLPAARMIKAWALLILGGIGIPLASIASINFALASKGMWVLVYPSGLFIRRKKEVVALPWDELSVVQFENFPDSIKLEIWYNTPDATRAYSAEERLELVDAAFFEMKKASTMGSSLTLVRGDAKGANLSNILIKFPELSKTIQIETFRRWYPNVLERLREGGAIMFGVFSVTLAGITNGTKFLSWADFGTLKRKQKIYIINQKKKWGAWAKISAVTIPNWHLFEALTQLLTELHRVPDERDDYDDTSD